MSNIEFTNDSSAIISRESPSSSSFTTTNSFRKFITTQTSLEEINKASHWFDQDRIDYHTLRFHDAIQKQLLNRTKNPPSEKDKKTAQSLLDIIRLKYIFPYSRLLGLFTYFYIVTIKNLFRGN
ncbi:hypothetical protein C9374_011748 [Naegleria lovaniensis]|uniref:Uncharacterized protein n=1 Tax=Naegleria lovaniensis TaxID=51637 RepID=A0AA88KD50_NAELO|nr:uncharacterized protein C9374_011748 [Naegleria lovaniensis]KAG2373863.1 hypothetical protein C9374_011748 [Naegleria lovaniensis]